jgi:hypothetical protein
MRPVSQKGPQSALDFGNRAFEHVRKLRAKATTRLVALYNERTNPPASTTSIHDTLDWQKRLVAIGSEIEFLQNDGDATVFGKRTKSIKDLKQVNVPAHILMNSLTQNNNPVQFVDDDVCECGSNMHYNDLTATLTCTKCGRCRRIIKCDTDFDDKAWGRITVYERGPLYRRFLDQFDQNSETPPQHVYETIRKIVQRGHLTFGTKVRPTPVAAVLRSHGLQKWVHHSMVIVKTLNGEPVPILDSRKIDRLVLRFNKLAKLFNDLSGNRKKILNFEYLTRQFLNMDCHKELGRMFACHKTREVLIEADERLSTYCKLLRRTDELSWPHTRSW